MVFWFSVSLSCQIFVTFGEGAFGDFVFYFFSKSKNIMTLVTC